MEQLNYDGALDALNAGANISRIAWSNEKGLTVEDNEVKLVDFASGEKTLWEPTAEDMSADDYFQLATTFFEDQNPSIGLEGDGKKPKD